MGVPCLAFLAPLPLALFLFHLSLLLAALCLLSLGLFLETGYGSGMVLNMSPQYESTI